MIFLGTRKYSRGKMFGGGMTINVGKNIFWGKGTYFWEKDLFLGNGKNILGKQILGKGKHLRKGKHIWEKPLESPRRLQGAPEGSRKHPESPRRLQDTPRSPQDASEGTQEAPGGSRKLQEAPGGPGKPHFKAIIKKNSSRRPVLEPNFLECPLQNVVF